MKPIEYVASGTSHSRIVIGAAKQQYAIELINEIFSKLNNINNHKFSLLFNAYTEKGFGEIFKNYRSSVYKIHSDSGGLQIITQGKESNDSVKEMYIRYKERTLILQCLLTKFLLC